MSRSLFDQTHSVQFVRQKKQGVNIRSWLTFNKEVLSLLLPSEDSAVIFASESVRNLRRNYDTSPIGCLVFDFASGLLAGVAFRDVLRLGIVLAVAELRFECDSLLKAIMTRKTPHEKGTTCRNLLLLS